MRAIANEYAMLESTNKGWRVKNMKHLHISPIEGKLFRNLLEDSLAWAEAARIELICFASTPGACADDETVDGLGPRQRLVSPGWWELLSLNAAATSTSSNAAGRGSCFPVPRSMTNASTRDCGVRLTRWSLKFSEILTSDVASNFQVDSYLPRNSHILSRCEYSDS